MSNPHPDIIRCGGCVYFKEVNVRMPNLKQPGKKGECHANPPQVVVGQFNGIIQPASMWPPVSEENWCGAFTKKDLS